MSRREEIAPSDFDSPHIRSLDSNLRCPICHDYFRAPVQFSVCSHTFCSMCIRESLKSSSKCPNCKMEVSEGKLKRNGVVEVLVKDWDHAGPAILLLQSTAQSHSLKHQLTQDSQLQPPIKRLRSNSVTTNTVKSKLKPTKADITPLDDSSDVEVIDPNERENLNNRDPLDPKMAVKCPVCKAKMVNSQLNRHLESGCTITPPLATTSFFGNMMRSNSFDKKSGKGKEKESARNDKSMSNTSYVNMNNKKITALLKESGLSNVTPTSVTTPSSVVKYLIRRHGQWTILWNSNLDFADLEDPKRKSVAELKKELLAWEKVQDEMKLSKSLVTDLVQHENSHRAEFKRLTEQAQQSYRKAQPAAQIIVPRASNDIPVIAASTTPIGSPVQLEFQVKIVKLATPLPFALSGYISPSTSRTPSPSIADISLSHMNRKSSPVPIRKRVSSPYDPEGPRPSQRERVEDYGYSEGEGGDSSFEHSLGKVEEDENDESQ